MLETFVVAILFLFINLLFCFKRVPIVAILIGLFTFFITGMVFMSDSTIPAQPHFSWFVIFIATISMIVNALDLRE